MNAIAWAVLLACSLGATERDQVTAISAGTSPEGVEAPFASAVRRVEQLGGKFEFDPAGKLIGIDLAADRVSLSDADLPCLTAFPHLQKLRLSGNGVTCVGLETIATIAGLTELSLLDAQVDGPVLERLTQLAKLNTLTIRRSPLLDDESLKQLRQFPQLRKLGILECGIGNPGLTELAALAQLRLLDLRNCPELTNEGLQQLLALKGLKVLRLAGFQIDNATLKLVGQFPALTGVTIEDAAIDDAGLEPLGRLPLEEINLGRCYRVTDEGLRIVEPLANLRQFGIRDIPLTGEGLKYLQGKNKLTRLKLSGTGVEDAAVRQLATFVQLERLELRQTAVTDAAVDSLALLKNLRYLDLFQTGITDAGAQRLATRLPQCQIVH